MIKIGFSSLVCPGWDLHTIVAKASELGFDGFELRGLQGELNLPMVADLARHPEDVRGLCVEHGVELVSLGCSAALTERSPRVLAEQKAMLAEFVELASRLGCPNVRIYLDRIPRGDDRHKTLPRAIDAIRSVTGLLARTGVTLLVENAGDFPGSADLWLVVDGVEHPLVRAAWNQCNAMSLLERATNSIPRLGSKLGLVHVCDATFDDSGVLQEYTSLGAGDTEVARQIEILKGLVYSGYLVFEWPKLWINSLPAAADALPEAAAFLRERVDAKQAVLTAYKGDKNAPRLATHPAAVGAADE